MHKPPAALWRASLSSRARCPASSRPLFGSSSSHRHLSDGAKQRRLRAYAGAGRYRLRILGVGEPETAKGSTFCQPGCHRADILPLCSMTGSEPRLTARPARLQNCTRSILPPQSAGRLRSGALLRLICPLLNGRNPATARSRLDLPDPFGPRNTNSSPLLNANSTPS